MVCITHILNFATSDSFRGDGSHILYSRFDGTLSLTLATIFSFPAYSAHQCIAIYIRYLPTYLPTYVRTYVRTYIHTYIHTCIHWSCVHTYTHTYIQTDSIILLSSYYCQSRHCSASLSPPCYSTCLNFSFQAPGSTPIIQG